MNKLALLAAAGTFLLAACSDGSDETEEQTEETVEDLDLTELEDELSLEVPDLDSQVPGDWESALADSWSLGNPDNSGEEAECVGKALVEQIGIERLLELGVRVESVSEGMVIAAFTEEELSTIDSLTADCTA